MPLGTCYVCRTKGVLVERDHLPPVHLFSEPRPGNLITCRICKPCHLPTHNDDEAFRVFVTSFITRNAAAAELWKKKVVPRTLRGNRIKPFVNAVRKTFEPGFIRIGSVHLPAARFRADRVPIERVLTRITRGLYFKMSPYTDSTQFHFSVDMIDPFELRRIAFLPPAFRHFALGNEVYDCWCALGKEDVRYGVWVHMFFRSVAFAVLHRPRLRKRS
jgi:hypothetical protein